MMNTRTTQRVVVSLLLTGLTVAAHAGRFENYTKANQSPAKPVGSVIASYLGGSGTEWLVGGGFQPDGAVVLVGTTLGPTFAPAGTQPVMLGTDKAAAPEYKPKKDRRGRPVAPGYAHTDGAPFVVLLSADAQKITRAVRLPWASGSATDACVDAKGNIYVAGRAGTQLESAGTVVSADNGTAKPGQAFVMQLSPDTKAVQWIRTFDDPGKGPTVRLTPKGLIQVSGAHTYRFDADGKTAEVSKTHKVNNWQRAVSPVDMTYALGFDRNKHTGREPWRQPTLSIGAKPGPIDQANMTNYYGWDPKRVGTNQYRLVSDSSFRHLYYDDEGMLWAIGWSDGGNTVLERQPKDLDAKLPYKGLGFSSWGAGALSLSHILKIDPQTGKVLNKTLWCGYLSSKESPSSASVKQIGVAPDGSVILAGGSGFGLIQTGDALFKGRPGGPYVAVLDKDLSSIRFSSTLPATGFARIRQEDNWDIATGTVNGRAKALILTGAVAEKGHYDKAQPAPSRKPVQPKFGGGTTDGYFVLIDLGPAK